MLSPQPVHQHCASYAYIHLRRADASVHNPLLLPFPRLPHTRMLMAPGRPLPTFSAKTPLPNLSTTLPPTFPCGST